MLFKEELKTKHLFFDGAMGTMLQASGLKAGELPELWNVTHPDVVIGIHEAYIRKGADIIKTNTFGCNRLKFTGKNGMPSVAGLVEAAVQNARKAMLHTWKDGYVALDMGPTGKLLQPYGDLPFEEAVSLYAEQVRAGVNAGADLILIETMSDSYEAKAAMLAAKENSVLPIVVTFTFDQEGKLLNGADVETAMTVADSLGADAVGFNCGLGPDQLAALLPRAMAATALPIVVNPNAGLPVERDGRTIYEIGPEAFAQKMRTLAQGGASILGGCCGTTPEHIGCLVEQCYKIPLPAPRTDHVLQAVTGYGQAVPFGKMPVIIGERINPTGKKLLKEALKADNMDYVCQLAMEQIDKGAQVLDVNVGVPGVDEPALLEKTVRTLQSITSVPLQIDTSNVEAMERALRIYNGRPLLNSVNGKNESLEQVLPLAKKYGAMLVGLCLDDEGISETAEGRLKSADKIIERARTIGMDPQVLLIDPLAMTISTGPQNAQVALEIIRQLKLRGIKTVMGVSNISFGLPHREAVNSAFFAMALQMGLSAGIINPNTASMMEMYVAYGAISGYDDSCLHYVSYFSDVQPESREAKSLHAEVPSSGQKTFALDEAIEKGLIHPAEDAVREMLLKKTDPLDIINNWMIPALDRVGKKFEQKTLFLPQLLMSADAAKAGFEIIKKQMSAQAGTKRKKGEPIIIATVKGDIHDIGKNIVKVLLENYGYDVIDLGKDVPPETVVKSTLDHGVRLVGLSALMTTTVASMAETIRQLRARVPGCRVIVGGAVLTEEYAKAIGADCYAANAVAAVHYANAVCRSGKEDRP
jgi:5-methyltetrahydrofolate--homocysteine methyltransferase